MSDRLPLMAAYALVGVALAVWPLALRPRAAGFPAIAPLRPPVPTSIRGLAGAILGLEVGSVLPWWRHDGGFAVNVSWVEAALLAVIACIAIWQLLPSAAQPPRNRPTAAEATVFAFAIAALSFSTVTFQQPGVLLFAWHHWGAYIGPTELLLAGARIFLDYPPQYGLGPTLLIAAGCGETCWTWAYYVVGMSTLLFAALTAALALRVAQPRNAAQRALVLLLCIACCFFWVAYPPRLGSPLATPSVSGMRFLPALALAALLLRSDRDGREFPYAVGHVAWALAVLWSFDSAFFATAVWWPYYLLLRQASAPQTPLTTLVRSVLTLLLVMLAWAICFLAGYWLAYGTRPTPMGLFAYILNPPGPLPVNLKGTMWFFIASIGLATWVNVRSFRRHGNTAEVRLGVLLTLLAYASFSYFLSRSHDNNVLNLLPFVLLVLLHVWAQTDGFARGLSAGLLAGLLGWAIVFNWTPWQTGLRSGAHTWFDPHWIEAALPGSDPAQARFPETTRAVVARTQSLAPDPVTVIGPVFNPSSRDADALWSALHGPANLFSFESTVRRDFLHRTAARLRRSGWLVVQTSEPLAAGLVADFDSVYTRTQQFEAADYLAIHYSPR